MLINRSPCVMIRKYLKMSNFSAFFLHSFLFRRHNSKCILSLWILNIPNDCSAKLLLFYLCWALCELQLASYDLLNACLAWWSGSPLPPPIGQEGTHLRFMRKRCVEHGCTPTLCPKHIHQRQWLGAELLMPARSHRANLGGKFIEQWQLNKEKDIVKSQRAAFS